MNRRIRRGISCEVLVFPPAAPVTVAVDGRPIANYVGAQVAGGRVYAPLGLLRMLVDRIWIENGAVVVERDDHIARIPLSQRFCSAAGVAGVAIAPLLRSLGDSVWYQAATHTLEVRTAPPGPVASAQPFAGAPVAPRAVFTAEPVATPRPTWSASPLPRRTPLPAPPS